MCRFYESYNDKLIVAPVVLQIQSADNESKTIVAPVVPQLQELNDLSDIRNEVLPVNE